MRVLLCGPIDSPTIPKALRRAHILFDEAPNPEQTQPDFSNHVYDLAVIFAPEVRTRIPTILHALRSGGVLLPILVVAARATAHERISAFDAGADDFLTRPFVTAELLSRMRALTRRGAAFVPAVLGCGDLRLDTGLCALSCGGRTAVLSAKELHLLELFFRNPTRVLSRDRLLHSVWGDDCEPAYNTLQVYLSLLRKKLRTIGSSVRIRAKRELGYYLDPPSRTDE